MIRVNSITLSAPLLFLFCVGTLFGQNAIIVVIDGVRYSESFGSEGKYIPRIWNNLRPLGTIYANCYINGNTVTIPGVSSALTGTWQYIANDGSERPKQPTVFEYFRKKHKASESSCFLVAGKSKLQILTHSTSSEYGRRYGASSLTDECDNVGTWEKTQDVFKRFHPRLMVVGFPETDRKGHDGDWLGYLQALREVDSLIGVRWITLQADSVYRNNTTLFITNDHGRHDNARGGFKNHGDACDGCRHIALLVIGPDFTQNTVVTDTVRQIDVGPTVGKILRFATPHAEGKSLLAPRQNRSIH